VLTSDLSPEPVAQEHRILRLRDVESKTGFKRAHLYTLMQKGEFPAAVRLGARAIGWDSVEVEQWVAERLTHRVTPSCR